jgi:uncharacterized membrane protein
MESRAKLFGHPIHQQLIVFPLGLLAMAVIFDLFAWGTQNRNWSIASFYMIGAGTVMGLVAAVFGLIDWLAIPPNTRAKKIGAIHGIGNVFVVLLFAASFYMRWDTPANAPDMAYVWSYAGAILALMTGWLGGELVTRLGVGIDEGSNLNAPNSMTGHYESHPAPQPRTR